jgi:sugar phosphate isomerase/epimerase
MNNAIKRSVSLYSYQDEYSEGRLDLEGCMRETAKTGAVGVELLAEQMMKRFPILTEKFKEQWFAWLQKYGLTPSCYDAFLENRIYDNRTLKLSEQVNMMKRDIHLASELGFHVLRTLCSTPMDVIEGSLDYAAEADVKISLEVHSPFSLNSGWAEGYMEMIRRTGTKHFGFIPDFGIFCKKIPDLLAAQVLRQGVSAECVKIVNEAFEERVQKGFVKIKYDTDLGKANREYMEANGLPALLAAIEKAKGGKEAEAYAMASFQFTWNDPQDIVDNIAYIYHTHAKCYNTNKDYVETSVAIPEVVAAYKKAGYQGYLSTEYEGQRFLDDKEGVDEIEQVRRHQEALRRAIEA